MWLTRHMKSSSYKVVKGANRRKVIETNVLRLLERASDHAVYITTYAHYPATGQIERQSRKHPTAPDGPPNA